MNFFQSYVRVISLRIHFWLWMRTHTLEDFKDRLERLGCTKTYTHSSVIFTTPKGGRVEVTKTEIIINPK